MTLSSSSIPRRVRLHIHGKSHRFRAICHLGFEITMAQEFVAIGVAGPFEMDDGGIEFETKLTEAWKVLAFSRICTKLLMTIGTFSAENFGKFEKELTKIPWDLYLPTKTSPEVQVTCRRSRLYHSDALKERALTIIEDALGAKNDLNTLLPSVQKVVFRLENNLCRVFVDLSGEFLYKRGFDRFVERAPLKETLAASILWAAGLFSVDCLIDPMAGSGTFSLEAAMWAQGKTPAKCRHFAFEDQPGFKKPAWNHLIEKEAPSLWQSNPLFMVSDLAPKAVKTILHNITACQLNLESLKPELKDFFCYPTSTKKSLLVLNPPYGKRMEGNTLSFYKEIGKKIKTDFNNSNWAIVCPNSASERALNLEYSSIIRSNHGGLDISILIKNKN